MPKPLVDPNHPAADQLTVRDALAITIISGAAVSFGALYNQSEITKEKLRNAGAAAADVFINLINQE